jgi:hypothetical protein
MSTMLPTPGGLAAGGELVLPSLSPSLSAADVTGGLELLTGAGGVTGMDGGVWLTGEMLDIL